MRVAIICLAAVPGLFQISITHGQSELDSFAMDVMEFEETPDQAAARKAQEIDRFTRRAKTSAPALTSNASTNAADLQLQRLQMPVVEQSRELPGHDDDRDRDDNKDKDRDKERDRDRDDDSDKDDDHDDDNKDDE